MSPARTDIQIRPLQSLDEFYTAAELQRVYWGDDLESVVPAQMMHTIVTYGGHVLGALDGNRLVGILIGLLGTNIRDNNDRPAMANLLIASKRMVVLPEYRGLGIGEQLKRAQRTLAIKQGIRLVTWTFDPLRVANAHLNLRKLGAVGQKYHENLYGTEERGGLALYGWSDRLRVDWWVTNRRVEERLNGTRADLRLIHYLEGNATLVNPSIAGQAFIQPTDDLKECTGSFALVEIPMNFDAMIEGDPEMTRNWQTHIRQVMGGLFMAGYIVTDFLRESYEDRDRAFYLMSYNMGFDYSMN
jgi:predicted GNAT superfamily acetyltransferase